MYNLIKIKIISLLVPILILASIFILFLSGKAEADETFIVTTNADSGEGSLRWALTQTCEGVRTVNFTISDQVIVLSSSLVITGTTTIEGGHRITISGGGSVRPFIVNSGASLRLQGLTVANGSADEGGAIYNDGGDIRVVRCTLLNNSATSGGGAIYNNGGTCVLNTCTMSGNSAEYGGVVYNNAGSVRLQYVTACENSASVLGAVVYTDGTTGTAGTDGTNDFDLIVHRSILWNNLAPACETACATSPTDSTQIADVNGTTVSVTQCIIQGGYPGEYDSTGLTVWDFAKDHVQEMPNNLDVDPLLGPLGYPRYSGDWQLGVPDIQKANTNEVSTMMYEPLPGSPAHFAIYGFYDNDDWREDPDDVYEQRGSWLRRQVSGGNEVYGASIGSCFIGFQNPYIIGNHPTDEEYPNPNYWGEPMSETNIIQSTEVLQPFQPVTMTITSPYCPPISYAGGEVFFVIPNTPTGPSCTISPNPAKIAADGTVTFTPVANGYVGKFTVIAHVLYHPPYYDYLAGKEITLTNTPGQHLVVTNEAADSTFGSLRWATENVAERGLITFAGDLTCPLTQQPGKEQPTVLYDIDGEDHEIVITAEGTASVMTVGRGGSPIPVTISNVTIADGFFSDSGFSWHAGGAYIRNGDISFINVKFRNNSGDYGGAMSIESISKEDGGPLNLKLINCVFEGNTAGSRGGALFLAESDAEIDFINCTFTGNQAVQGGAIYNQSPGFIAMADGMRQRFSNCIFWDNTATDSYPTIYTEAGRGTNSVTFSNCDIPNSFPAGSWDAALGINGGGNIDSDPLFADATVSDYRLSDTSPCINVGNNGSVPADITEDIIGNTRIFGGTVDMGAYEYIAIVQHAVTFDSQGGSAVSSQSVNDGGLVIEPVDPTRTDYIFNGWYDSSTGGNLWDFANYTISIDTTLYAQWTINSYTVTFDANGGTGTMSPQT
ncbi:InlB B-repeat-containing protein, partial [Desulfamplus magnetovallimortis]|uniref:InlB B-repeat-containing protein n=1 Tax=Desulfamplus magnetovallimortis TaxID=1246637 RepID=UPI001646E1B8